MRKIVVLDGYVLNPGDLSWDGLKKFGEVTVYDRTPPDLVLERSAGAEILLTNKTVISADTISRLPGLRYIGLLSTGVNVVDLDAAGARGIVVTNVPAYSTMSVAQLVFALILEFCTHVQAHSDAVRAGEWSNCPDFSFWKYPQEELDGKIMGIIGFGSIGRQVARIASVFGMHVLASSRTRRDVPEIPDIEWAEIDDVLRRADIISLHVPLTDDTRGMINKRTIDFMKRSAILINTARGPLVVDADLADALNDGRIAGAGLDVLTVEPPPADNPLLTAKNCLITPHIAWATLEARTRLMNIAVKNVECFLASKPTNVVGAGSPRPR